jgi:uncharacterized membrane protein
LNRKLELLIKVMAWRAFSMCYGFCIAFFFTRNAADSIGIVLITGTTLTFLQWGFEIIWDKYFRENLRHALSRQQGRIGWMVWFRRSPRTVSMDKYEQRSNRGEESENSSASQDAG